jgi:hypothetical protein
VLHFFGSYLWAGNGTNEDGYPQNQRSGTPRGLLSLSFGRDLHVSVFTEFFSFPQPQQPRAFGLRVARSAVRRGTTRRASRQQHGRWGTGWQIGLFGLGLSLSFLKRYRNILGQRCPKWNTVSMSALACPLLPHIVLSAMEQTPGLGQGYSWRNEDSSMDVVLCRLQKGIHPQ